MTNIVRSTIIAYGLQPHRFNGIMRKATIVKTSLKIYPTSRFVAVSVLCDSVFLIFLLVNTSDMCADLGSKKEEKINDALVTWNPNEQNQMTSVSNNMDVQNGGVSPELLYGKRYRIFYPVHIRKSNSVTVPDSDSWYKMGPYPRGRMIVINNKNFLPCTGLEDKPREGSGSDVEALVNLFLKLGYVVEVFEDLQKHEMTEVMRSAASKCYKNYGAFVCALLTHGEDKFVYAVDGALEIRELTTLFCNNKLAGIPKVFLIEASRCAVDNVTLVDQCDGKLRREESLTSEQRTLSLPQEADFLFAYSTVSGYNSWLNPMGGSWFIQALCMVVSAHARDMDLLRMLTKVNELVSRQRCLSMSPYTQEKESTSGRQIASVVSQLRKEFYFFPPLLAT